MLNKLINLYKSRRETVNYLFFGVLTTLVNWIAFALAVTLAKLSITAGNTIAWIVAVAFAYVTNKLWVFESLSWGFSQVLREACSFIGARLATGALEIFGVPLLIAAGLSYPLFGVPGFAAKAIVSVVVIVLNYVFSKLWVFRRGE